MNLEDFNNRVLPLKNKLFRFALSVVANKETAEDVVQDTFFKLWKKRESLGEILNLEAWSMRMVKNQCLDHFKSKFVQTKGGNPDPNQAGINVSPYKQTELNSAIANIQNLMAQLPEKQRMIFKLRDIEEYSYKEIADIMEVDISVVKVNLHRARKFIRQQLEKNEAYGL